jgi:hypothetical protein
VVAVYYTLPITCSCMCSVSRVSFHSSYGSAGQRVT